MNQPQRAPRKSVSSPQAQARLKLVSNEHPRSHQLRRTCLRLVFVLLVGLFVIGALQAVVTQSQGRIDQLNIQIDEALRIDRELRLQRAELLSPERLALLAQDRLGMVPPATVKYLDPVIPPAP